MNREAWRATVHKVIKSQTRWATELADRLIHIYKHGHISTYRHTLIQTHSPMLICPDTHRHTHIDMQVQGHACTLNRYSLFCPSHSLLPPYLISSTPLHRLHLLSAWELCAHYFFCLGPSSFHLSSECPGLWSLLSDTCPGSLGCLGASCHHSYCMCIHLSHDTYCASVQLFHKAGVSVCPAPSCVPRT